MTLKSDQSQQIEDEDEDDEMTAINESPLGNDIDGNFSDSNSNSNFVRHSVSMSRRRHSSSSDPVNLSIERKQHSQQDDSDDANIDVETISNAPTKVSFTFAATHCSFLNFIYFVLVANARPLLRTVSP